MPASVCKAWSPASTSANPATSATSSRVRYFHEQDHMPGQAVLLDRECMHRPTTTTTTTTTRPRPSSVHSAGVRGWRQTSSGLRHDGTIEHAGRGQEDWSREYYSAVRLLVFVFFFCYVFFFVFFVYQSREYYSAVRLLVFFFFFVVFFFFFFFFFFFVVFVFVFFVAWGLHVYTSYSSSTCMLEATKAQ